MVTIILCKFYEKDCITKICDYLYIVEESNDEDVQGNEVKITKKGKKSRSVKRHKVSEENYRPRYTETNGNGENNDRHPITHKLYKSLEEDPFYSGKIYKNLQCDFTKVK